MVFNSSIQSEPKDSQVAFCGLVCCVCPDYKQCGGCRVDTLDKHETGSPESDQGREPDKFSCHQRECCLTQHRDACWGCGSFPCRDNLFNPPVMERLGWNELPIVGKKTVYSSEGSARGLDLNLIREINSDD